MFYFQEETWASFSGEPKAWKDIAMGPLELSVFERNDQWKTISSSYESGDESKFFSEVSFLTNTDVYSEYRYVEISADDMIHVFFGIIY